MAFGTLGKILLSVAAITDVVGLISNWCKDNPESQRNTISEKTNLKAKFDSSVFVEYITIAVVKRWTKRKIIDADRVAIIDVDRTRSEVLSALLKASDIKPEELHNCLIMVIVSPKGQVSDIEFIRYTDIDSETIDLLGTEGMVVITK